MSKFSYSFHCLALVLTASLFGCGSGSAPPKPFTIAVIGDSPYGASPTDTAEFAKYPSYVAAINNDKDVSMVLHTGDIHSGKEYCTQAYNQSIYNLFQSFTTPLLYVPGDNEWIDCQKSKEGGGTSNSYALGDPYLNLDLVRSVFFSQPGKTLGQNPIAVQTQATQYDKNFPSDKAYVENTWFEKSNVLIATINLPGGSNNGASYLSTGVSGLSKLSISDQTRQQEIDMRTGAALRWLDTIFATAKANRYSAILIMVQGDMWDLDSNRMSDKTLTEWKQYIDKLAALTKDFDRPVLLTHNDSHFYRSDNPLVLGAECKIEVPSTPIGKFSKATESCLSSVSAGALKPIIPDGITYADAYRIVQDKTNPNYLPSYNVPNFHRLVGHGNATAALTDMEYIKLTIDPSKTGITASEKDGVGSFGPFSWTRVQPKL
jgi:Calcineurin-like phosphoesterase